ncbi:MAG: hypothetical protein JWR10_946 [Rubritepida sp.]|nr:hypothetical protein [Rubritepida sp.]
MSLPRRAFLASAAALAGCANLPEPRICVAAHSAIRVIARSWHTEIAVPAAAMGGFSAAYPGASTLLFGFGKRNFMISAARGLSEWLAGPFPGRAVMQVTALSVPPEEAMAATILALPIDDAGLERLADALWNSFSLDTDGRPTRVSQIQGSDFFEASRDYGLDYTCNTWTAHMLSAGGFPVWDEDVVLSGAIMRQVTELPGACRPEGRRPPLRA